MTWIHHYSSPLGGITLASDGDALTGLWFDGQKHFGRTLSPDAAEASLPVFEQAEAWLDTYFSGRAPDFTPRLRLEGSAFRTAVWEILLTVPFGRTVTYGMVAKILSEQQGGANVSPRAVGGAVGHNPISLIVPCHRVVGVDGSLTGYAGGIGRKRRLLTLEGVPLPGGEEAAREL